MNLGHEVMWSSILINLTSLVNIDYLDLSCWSWLITKSCDVKSTEVDIEQVFHQVIISANRISLITFVYHLSILTQKIIIKKCSISYSDYYLKTRKLLRYILSENCWFYLQNCCKSLMFITNMIKIRRCFFCSWFFKKSFLSEQLYKQNSQQFW